MGAIVFQSMGGTEPGSAGCIDLTENMADFTQWLKKHGQDLIVKVSYRDEFHSKRFIF